MMELDEFRTLTKEKPGKVVYHNAFMDLEGMITKRSKGIVEKIKRNLVLELLFALGFIVFDLCIIFKYQSIYIRGFAYLTLLFCIWFTIYLCRIYRKIREQESTQLSIKENLQNVISIIAGFTRLYFQLTMVLLPFGFFSGLLIGYLNRISFRGDLMPVISSNEIFTYVSAFAAWSFAMFIFTRWYLKKLYGTHKENLRNQLKELDNVQNDS